MRQAGGCLRGRGSLDLSQGPFLWNKFLSKRSHLEDSKRILTCPCSNIGLIFELFCKKEHSRVSRGNIGDSWPREAYLLPVRRPLRVKAG